MAETSADIAVQHLIDPEICIRCNTCEATCPVDAITHDSRNYVVEFEICNRCMACIPPCPTGAIDNWRRVPKVRPTRWRAVLLGRAARADRGSGAAERRAARGSRAPHAGRNRRAGHLGDGALVGREAYINLYTPQSPITATVSGNFQLTEAGASCDIHHIVLDFGTMPFPVLEGQSIGIMPPGTDAKRQALLRAPVLDGQPAQRRAPALQQPVAHREARHRGPRAQAGARLLVRTTCAT